MKSRYSATVRRRSGTSKYAARCAWRQSPAMPMAVTSDDCWNGKIPWGGRRRWAIPMEMLSGSGEELRRVLLVNGLSYISTTGEARARLMEYISLCKPERRVTCVSRTGWHGQVYVLQGWGQRWRCQGCHSPDHFRAGRDFRVSGTTEEWREHVSRYCTGNSRVAFAVSGLCCTTVTAGWYGRRRLPPQGNRRTVRPPPWKRQPPSAAGLTTGRRGRATGNAGGCASRRNDAAMMLDRIREVDGRRAGNYRLHAGKRSGQGVVPVRTVSCVPVSIGACCSFQLASCLWRTCGKGRWAYFCRDGSQDDPDPQRFREVWRFEELHGFDSGKALAEHLEWATSCYYGSPFREWLKALTADLNGLTAQAKSLMKEYAAAWLRRCRQSGGPGCEPLCSGGDGGWTGSPSGYHRLAWGWSTAGNPRLPERMAERSRAHRQSGRYCRTGAGSQFLYRESSTAALQTGMTRRNRPGNMVGWRRVEKGSTAQGTKLSLRSMSCRPAGRNLQGIWPAQGGASVRRSWIPAALHWWQTQTTIRPPEMNPRRLYVFNSEVPG